MVDCLFALHILEIYNEALHWFQESIIHFMLVFSRRHNRSVCYTVLLHNVDFLNLCFVLNDLAVYI
jgi:hypothetical protein